MRQYVWLFPWCPSLSWASTRMVNFYDLGITSVRNCLLASEMCLYRSPFTWVKVSNWWCGALPFNSLLEMHLQKGSVLCICSNASRWSAVNDFGVGVDSWDMRGVGSIGRAEVESEVLWVWLLVWKAGPSFREAVSMLIDIPIGKTSLERQSAALFLAPEIHSNVILYVASSRLHLFTLLLVFLPLRNHARGLWSFRTMISAPCR